MKPAVKFLLLLLVVAGFSGGSMVIASDDKAAASSGRVPMPVITQGKGDECVEPTDVMRRDHMEFILHQRDDTVHSGIRSKKHSLKECIECHVQRDTQGRSVPINAKDQFCQGCHQYAAVTIDCFECHATTPEGGAANLRGIEGHSMLIRGGLTDAMAMGEQFLHQTASNQ